MVTNFRFKPLPMALMMVLGSLGTHSAIAQDGAEACQRLDTLVQQASGKLREQFSDAPVVVAADDAAQCGGYVDRIAASGGISENTESDDSTATMDLEEDATIDGKVRVTLPDPEIDVAQDPADVSVTTRAPDVKVNQGQPTITIKQAKPIIKVEMPQPTITVEQPAPEITIVMPEPGVDVANAKPTVDVVIPEPRVTVRQGEPNLNVDLALDEDNAGSSGNNANIDRSDNDGVMTVNAEGLTEKTAKPNIQFKEDDKQANVSVESSEPEVNYVGTEPDIEFDQADGKPTIEVIESGDPKVTISTAKAGEASTQQAAMLAEEPPKDAQSQSIAVNALSGMSVVNGAGKQLGSVDRVVKNGNEKFVIIEHGAWLLGLNGKEIALPVNDTFVKGESVVLRDMTEKQIKDWPEYSYANEVSLEESEQVEVQKSN